MSLRAALCLVPTLALTAFPACQRVPAGPYAVDEDGDDTGDDTGDGDGESGGTTGGGGQPTYHCDPGEEQPCPEGEKCTALEMSGHQNVYDCVPDSVDHVQFDDCIPAPTTGQDGCIPGTICLGDDVGSKSGVCLPLCKSEADCELALCIADVFSGVKFCADHCDPVGPLCGHNKLDCLHTGDRFTCHYPTDEDVGDHGDPCDGIGDRGCSEGNVCLQGEIIPGCGAGFCCGAVCDLDEPDTCESPTTCNPLGQDPPPGFEHVGACYVPF